MIDIEAEIYTMVKDAVKAEFPKVSCSSEFLKSPPSLPFISVEEKLNETFSSTGDSGHIENHALISFEVNVCTNKVAGKKQEARNIFAVADSVFLNLGFSRSSGYAIPNLDDQTIFRITARYTAVVSRDKTIYRRI